MWALVIWLLPYLFGPNLFRRLVQAAKIRQVGIEPSVIIRKTAAAEFELLLLQYVVRPFGLGGGGSRRVGPHARVARTSYILHSANAAIFLLWCCVWNLDVRDTYGLVLEQIDLLPRTLQVLFTALIGATARSHNHLGHLLQPFRRLRFAKV